MNENIQLEMNPSVKKQRSIATSIALFSQDIDNYSFDITFTDLELQAGDQVEVLAKLKGGKIEHKSSANLVEVDGELIARYVFDTKLIDGEGHVFCYVYLKRGDKSADVGAFYFEVDLSELDKVGGKIAEVYDGRYEDLVAEFEIKLQEYRDGLPQADSVRAEVDEVIAQFGLDSQAKLNQYDGDAQQVIADNQTAFDLAETTRKTNETTRISNEDARKSAEGNRQSTFEANEANRQQEFEENEIDRHANETIRQSQEESREIAETSRQQAHDDLIDTGVMQENINQKLAASEAEYAPRLTSLEQNDAELTARLAQTVKIGESGVITPAMASQELKEQMTGGSVAIVGVDAVLEENLTDGAVTPKKTTFFKVSRNLLNPDEIQYDKSINPDGEEIDQSGRVLSGIMSIMPGDTIRTNISPFRFVGYTEDMVKIAYTTINNGTYTVVPESLMRYFRISPPSHLYDPETSMSNIGDELLPYEPYGVKILDEYLPNMQKPLDLEDLKEDILNEIPSIDAEALKQDILSEVDVLYPYPPKLRLDNVIYEGFASPYWLSEDGKMLLGAHGVRPYMSLDEWDTLQEIGSEYLPRHINGMRELFDGEILATTSNSDSEGIKAKVYKTVGFDRNNPSAATWKKVLETGSTLANINNIWGMSVYENIVVLSEYGKQGVDGSNYVYLSKDSGDTFTEIFDLKSQEIEGRPPWDSKAHVHTVAYDPYFNRIWLVVGDSTNRATYYTDDYGDTWRFVPGSNEIQFTGIIAMQDCVVFGSDHSSNGLYIYRRKDKDTVPVINPWFLINDSTVLTHAFGLPYRKDGRKNTPVYFNAQAQRSEATPDPTVIMGFVDGKKAHLLYESEKIHSLSNGRGVIATLGDTAQGNVIIVNSEPDTSGVVVYKTPAPIWE